MPKPLLTSSADLALHYAVHACSLGYVLLAATSQGMAAVLLGDSPPELLTALQQRYPQRALVPGGAVLQRWGATVLNIVEHPRLQHVVPLDVLQGTDFQRQVWKALRGIPAGQTRTYADMAHAVGRPQAVRAVASACGANPLAILVPCHRVLRSDGGLGGYRWGIARKQQLLRQEAQELLPQ